MAAPDPSDQLETKLRSMILQNNSPTPDQTSQSPAPSRGGGHRGHRARGSQNFRAHDGRQPQPNAGRGHHAQQPSRDFDQNRGQGSNGRVFAGNRQRAHHVQQASRDNVNWRVNLGSPASPASQQPHQHTPNRPRASPSKFVPLQRSLGRPDDVPMQCQFLEDVARVHLPNLEMSEDEFVTKDKFRLSLQGLLQEAVLKAYPQDQPKVTLQLFGSLSSGFAMPGSDMDLALSSSHDHPDIFRVFQRVLLDSGIGARVLSRTRVPILKICELPTPELLAALREDRELWDKMTPDEREAHDDGRALEKPKPVSDDVVETLAADDTPTAVELVQAPENAPADDAPASAKDASQTNKPRPHRKEKSWYREKRLGRLDFPKSGVGIQCDINYENLLGIHNSLLLRCYSHCDVRVRLLVLFVKGWASKRKINSSYSGTLSSYGFVLMVLHYLVNIAHPPICPNLQTHRLGGDAQSRAPPDANDANQLCNGYDVRFWRAEQEILSLAGRQMLTHNREPLGALLRGFFQYYAQQGSNVPRGGFAWTQQVLSLRTPGGIITKATKGWTGATTTLLNADGTTTLIPNTANATNSRKMHDTASTSTPGRSSATDRSAAPPTFTHGTLRSADPMPASPPTAPTDTPSHAAAAAAAAHDTLPPGAREVRNRYLFAIEDPFETTHNVARTVTHPGIVAIRDEFRRAWRILQAIGRGQEPADGDLMEPVVSVMPAKEDHDTGDATAGAGHAEEPKETRDWYTGETRQAGRFAVGKPVVDARAGQ